MGIDPAALVPGEAIEGKGAYSFDIASPVGSLAVLRQADTSFKLYDKAELLAEADLHCPPGDAVPGPGTPVTPSPATTPTGGPLPTTGVDVPVGPSPAMPQEVAPHLTPDTTPVPGITGKTDAERVAELEAQLADLKARDESPPVNVIDTAPGNPPNRPPVL